jgi:hypothetical protein
MILELKNDFHNTRCRLRVQVGEYLSVGQVKRARRELCGIPNCVCGNELGCRGWQGQQQIRLDYEDMVAGPDRTYLPRVVANKARRVT